jgi:hypothetical protein
VLIRWIDFHQYAPSRYSSILGGTFMKQRGGYQFDNRDSAEVYQYMEARIEALKRRIQELEAEKEALPCTVSA